MARKAVRNAKRNNDIDFEARRVLPDFDTEDEDSEMDQSNTENQPVASTSASVNTKPAARAQSNFNGKGKARELSQAAADGPTNEHVSHTNAISPTDPAGKLTVSSPSSSKRNQSDPFLYGHSALPFCIPDRG